MNTVALLQDLIRIPSVNPDNNPGTDQVGEQAIADFLQPLLEELGYNVTQEEIFKGRPNLIAKAPGSLDRPRILLCPHLDTVGVENMTINPFSSDTKGSIATMIAGIANNREQLASLPVAVDFVAFMGEESSQHGSKHFAQKYASDYQFAIAGEPTMLDIVYTTKGSLWFTLEAKGKAAHSSQPELGENAVMLMAQSLNMMDQKLSDYLASYTHPVLGKSTLNIGTINGGSRPNIVPDYCTAEIDIRTTPDLERHSYVSKSYL